MIIRDINQECRLITKIKKMVTPSPDLYILLLCAIVFISSGCTLKVKFNVGSDIISKQVFYKPKDKAAFLRFPENFSYNYRSDLILLSRACQNPYEHSLLFLSDGGNFKSSIFLNYCCLSNIILVDIDHDGIYEFFSFSLSKVFLFDINGQIVWEYSPSELEDIRVTNIGLGDLDGDGLVEFVAAYIKRDDNNVSVHILDYQGNLNTRFFLPDHRFDFRYMKVFDTNGDGISEIVCNGRSGILIFDSEGNLLRNFKPDWGGWHLSLWNNSNEDPLIYGPKGKSILLTDLKGKTADIVHLSKSGLYFRHNPLISVFLRGLKDEAFFVATQNIGYVYDRSYLYIFNSSGRLIYEEVPPARIVDILKVTDDKSKKEYILISVIGTI